METRTCGINDCAVALLNPRQKRCQQHQKEYIKVSARELKRRKAADGVCLDCTSIATHGVYCEEHRHQYDERRAKYKSEGRFIGYDNKKVRVQKGLCSTCGRNAARAGLIKCDSCADKDARNNISRRNERITSGLCIYCGESVTVTVGRKRTSCDACRKRRKGYDGSVKSRFSRAQSTKRVKKYGWSLTLEEYTRIVAMPCNYCNLPNTTDQGVGLDRLNNKIGYHIGNVVSCCPECNMARNDIFTPAEMKILGAAVRVIKLQRASAIANDEVQ